ncbi:MAG: ubiquitin-like small modifier protein 1 [Chloroflexota bacterium]|nr:MoaD family protein [Dehalococcoidia bacterium]MDW8252280.1 ubiquitin-like small modifier protein 1 [Chloroflexota bacterium]
MSVQVRLPGPLESLTGGKRVLEAEGTTVSEVLRHLSEVYPGLRERVVAENGEIHRFVNIYLNDEDIRFIGGIETPVKDGDTLAILPALAGGADDEGR